MHRMRSSGTAYAHHSHSEGISAMLDPSRGQNAVGGCLFVRNPDTGSSVEREPARSLELRVLFPTGWMTWGKIVNFRIAVSFP